MGGVERLAWGPQAPPNKWPLQTLAAGLPAGLPGLGQSRSAFLGWKERPGARGFFIQSNPMGWTEPTGWEVLGYDGNLELLVFFPKKKSRFPSWKRWKHSFFPINGSWIPGNFRFPLILKEKSEDFPLGWSSGLPEFRDLKNDHLRSGRWNFCQNCN